MAIYTKDSFANEATGHWARIKSDLPTWHKLHSSNKRYPDPVALPAAIQDAIEKAWLVYSNASASTLKEMLLGDVKLRSELSILQNFGTTAGGANMMERGLLRTASNSGKISEEDVQAALSAQLTQFGLAKAEAIRQSKSIDSLVQPIDGKDLLYRGSVLNDGFWWPFVNDAWVLGAVHQLKIFHLTLASVEDDLLWDASAGRCRVLGRELIGLKAAGYSLIGLPTWKATTPVVPPVASGLSTASTTGVKASDAEVRAALGFTFAPTSKAKATGISLTSYLAEIDKYRSAQEIRDALLRDETSYASYDYSAIT